MGVIAGRTFLRIAWRECWRHPGRSALVVALVAFPVAVAAAALTARATIVPTPEEEHRLDYGTADLQVACRCPSPADPGALTSRAGQVEASLRDRLPPDAALLPVSGDVGLEVVAGDRAARRVEILSTDPHHPMHASRFRLDAGRLPTSADQITISPSLADEIDVGIGDVIELYPGGDEVEVVGLARERSGLRRPLAIILPGRVPTTTWWVDLPAAQRATDVAAGLADLADATPVERLLEPAQRTIDKAGEISAAYLASMFIFLWTGTVAAAAFAIGARRRLRQVGLLAANGGSPAHVRRLLLADAVVLGVVGSLVGVAVGVLATRFALPHVEGTTLLHHETGALSVPLLPVAGTVVVGTTCAVVAALLPAVRAARLPPTAALEGRVGRRPRHVRSTAGSLVLGPVGALLVARGAAGEEEWLVAAGTILVVTAVALLNRLVVAFLARVASHAGLSARFAARDAGRNGQRSGPALVASMLTIAATIGVVTILRSDEATGGPLQDHAERTISVEIVSADQMGLEPVTDAHPALVPALRDAVERVLPDAEIDTAVDTSVLARLGHRATDEEMARLRAAVLREVDGRLAGGLRMSVVGPPEPPGGTRAGQLGTVAVGTALSLIVLGLVAALSRAETAAEMSSLHALGISPRRRRRLAAAAAGGLALVAGALAIPTGLVPAIAFLEAKHSTGIDPEIVIPWAVIAGQVLGLPQVLATFGWLSALRPAPVAP